MQNLGKKIGDFEVLRNDLLQGFDHDVPSDVFSKSLVCVGIVDLKMKIILQQQDILGIARRLLSSDSMTADIARMMAEAFISSGSHSPSPHPSHLSLAA